MNVQKFSFSSPLKKKFAQLAPDMDVIAGRYGKILLLPCHMDGPPSKNVFSVFVSSGRKFRSDQTSLGPRAVAFSDGLSGVESLNC